LKEDDEEKEILFDWNMTIVDDRKLKFQLNFEKPNEITVEKFDHLNFEIINEPPVTSVDFQEFDLVKSGLEGDNKFILPPYLDR